MDTEDKKRLKTIGLDSMTLAKEISKILEKGNDADFALLESLQTDLLYIGERIENFSMKEAIRDKEISKLMVNAKDAYQRLLLQNAIGTSAYMKLTEDQIKEQIEKYKLPELS